MPKYTVIIGGKEKTIDKDKFDGNAEAIAAKYPDARIKAMNGEVEGMLPISNYSKAIKKGYRMVETGDVEPKVAPVAASVAAPTADSVQQRDSVRDYRPTVAEPVGAVNKPFDIVKEMNEPTDTEKRETERRRIEEQAERAKKDADERRIKSTDEVNHADAQAFRENPFSLVSELLTGVTTMTPKQAEARKNYELNRITTERTNDTFNMVEEAKKKGNTTFVEGFGRGFWEKASKLSNWDFGARELDSNLAVSAAAKKYSDGVPLLEEEEMLLDAVALEAAAHGEFSGDLGRGYKAGGTTAESIPFMAEFIINPATGTGKVVRKAMAKKLITNFGKEAAKSTIGKIARSSARVVGDVTGAGIMAGTTGAMRTSTDAVDRMTGEVKPTVDADGYYRFGGTEEGDSGMKAFAKAYGASTIENFSEMFGNYLVPMGAAAGELAGRSMKRIGLGKVNDIIGRVRSSDIAKIVDDFQGRTQWNGTIGEYLEEQAGMAMNALTVGDNQLSDLVDVDTQIDTFLGVSAFGGLFSSIKTGGYAREKYVQRKRMNEADREASGMIGEDWQLIKAQIDGTDDAELVSILTNTMSDESLGDKQKQAVLLYAGRLKAYHGANLADLKRKTEGDTSDEVVQAQINFDAGYKLAEADRKEKRKAAKELDEVERKLDDDFLSADESERYDLMRQRAEDGEDVSGELTYINVRSRFEGMIHGIRDVIDEKVAISNQYISGVTHQDGNVYDVTLSGDENKHVFPVSGTIVVDENGIIDRKHSDNRFIVRDENGKVEMRSVDDLYKAESMDNAETLKEVSAQSIREQESARHTEEIEMPGEEEKAEEVGALQSGSEVTLNVGGIAREAVVQNVYSDGGIELRFEDKITGHDGKEKNVDVFTAEEVTALLIPKEDVASRDGDVKNGTGNEVTVGENTGGIEMDDEKSDIVPAAVEVEAEALPGEEILPDAVAESEDTGSGIPIDEKGNLLYHRAAVESTLESVRSYGLDEAEMDEFVSAQRADASKRLEKLQKGKPKVGTNLAKYQSEKKAWEDSLLDAQSQSDYWNEVDTQVQATRVQPGDATAAAIASMGDAMNGSEFAAMTLGGGKLPLLFDDYKRETGFGNQDAKGMFGLFAAKANGGMSIEQAGEKLMEMDAANGTGFFDQTDANAGRNAVLDVLSSSRTRGDLFGYIKGNRDRMADQERKAESDAYESWVSNTKHMSVADYEADEDTFDSRTKEFVASYNFDEINGNIADDLIKEENDRRTEKPGIESISGGTTENIQGEPNQGAESGSIEQPEESGAIEESERGRQGGAEESVISGADVVGSEQPDGGVEKEIVFAAPEIKEGEYAIDYATRVVGAKELYDEQKKVETNPSEAQKEAGNYKMGHVKIGGHDVTIENPKGSVRRGVGSDGKAWETPMNNTYGYFRGTKGKDGDHVDVFLGENLKPERVYVVDQVNEDSSFDEHKVMYGFDSVEDAREAYLSNYEDGWQGLGEITDVPREVFDEWLKDGTKKQKPFAKYEVVQEKAFEEEAVDLDVPFVIEETNTVSPDESPTGESGIESKNLFDSAERIVEKEKINRDYDKALDAVNEFSEKCAGACKTLVVKSKELLRGQLEAIHIDSEDIDRYERWFDEKGTIAFHAPRYERIIILDTGSSKDELKAYLWHENVHAALNNLSNRDDIINCIVPLVEKHAHFIVEKVDAVYAEESEGVRKEEYVTHFFEELIKSGKESLMLQGDAMIVDAEANNAVSEILNQINNGKKESDDGLRGDIPRRKARNDGGGEFGLDRKVRNAKGDVGHNAEGGRVWNDLRSILEAGEERLRRKDEGESSDSGIDSQSFQESEDVAKQEYENALDKAKSKIYRWQEAYQDSMLGLKKMQEAIEKESGEKLKYFEDAYMAENQMSSRGGYETDVYKDKFFIPMMDAVRDLVKHGAKQEEVSRYVMAKHGLERNVVFAKRDAEQEAEDAFRDELSELNDLWDKGEIELVLFDERIEELKARKTAFYEAAYQKNRMRDYSGLKQLTDEEENFEEAAMDLVDAFEGVHSSLCDVFWEKVNAATKQTLKKSYESGLMTKSTYNKVRGMFEHYVPLRGWDDKVASDVYEYVLSERSVFQAPVKTAFGRESLADDPFANIGNMAESGILQGNRNLMKQKFLNMVLNHPTSLATVKTMWYENAGSSEKPVWEQSIPDIKADATADEIAQSIDDHEARMVELGKSGMAKKSTKGIGLDYRASTREINEHIVVVKSGGREYVIFVNGNPRAAQAINGLTNPDTTDHKFMQTVGKINRQLAANFTTRNPAFVLSNMSRDVIFSTSAIWVKEDWKYAKRFDKNIAKNIGGVVGLMARYKSGKLDMRNQRDWYFLEFLENGGETGYTALHNVEEYKKMMNRYVRKSDGALGSLSYGAHAIVGAVGFMNRCAENVSRFTTYQTSREMGRGVAESVRDAKEVTVNFNKKGAGGLGAGTLKSLFLFFNAAVQSLSNFKGLHDKSKPKFYTTLGGFAAAGILLPMINNAIIEMIVGEGDDDMTDEEREAWKKKMDAYDNLPEWVRRNNFCVWTGGEEFITIPLPIELRAFYGLGEMWYQMGRGTMNGMDGKLDVKQASLEMINQLTELLPINPLGGNGDAVSVVIPDAGKPFYQVFANRDFFGKPIYKKNDRNELMPAWTKAFSGTAKWMVNSAEFINEVSGGDKYMSGDVDLNPATVEHVFEGYFGGMGKTVNQLFKTLSMIWDEDERMWRNVPVANRFYSGSDNKISFRKVNEEYYRRMEEYDDTEQRMRGYENEAEMGIEEYAEKYNFLNESKEYERYELMKGYKKEIDAMYRAIKESDPEEKKEIEMGINLLKMEMIEEVGLIE